MQENFRRCSRGPCQPLPLECHPCLPRAGPVQFHVLSGACISTALDRKPDAVPAHSSVSLTTGDAPCCMRYGNENQMQTPPFSSVLLIKPLPHLI